MLLIIGIILLVPWLLGLLTHFLLGGFIHALLVIAIIVSVVRVIQGRNPLKLGKYLSFNFKALTRPPSRTGCSFQLSQQNDHAYI